MEELGTKPRSSSRHLFEPSPRVPSRSSEGAGRRKQGIIVKQDEWKKFLAQYGLKGEGESETASLTSDLQIGGVYEDSLDNKTDKRELGGRGT